MGIAKMVWSITKKKTAVNKTVDAVKASEVCVVLDHPQQGVKITAPHYTFRAGVSGDIERMEISINKEPGQSCRHSVGYWWYDWSAIAPGKHTLVARMHTADGRWFRTPVRTVEYRA